MIATGIPTTEVTQEPSIVPSVTAIENSALFDATKFISNHTITATEIFAHTITATEINTSSISIGVWGGDLDDVSDGTSYGRVASTSITAGKIVLNGGAGVSGALPVGNTDAKCTDPNADQTSANAQPSTWLSTNVEKAKLGTTIMTGGYMKTDMLNTSVAYISQAAMIANAIIDNAHINNLSADKINAGTLTGRTIRTASSGGRVEMVAIGGYSDYITFYGTTGILTGLITAATGTNTFFIQNPSTSNPKILFNVGGVQVLDLYPSYIDTTDMKTRDIYPAGSGSYDLGTSSLKYRHLYLSGDITLPSNTENITGDLVPTTNDYYELGLSTSQKWYKIWAHYTAFGDVGFANDFRLTEEEGEKEGLAIYNRQDKKIMVLDEDGNLWIPGEVKSMTNLQETFPFHKKIYAKKELKKNKK